MSSIRILSFIIDGRIGRRLPDSAENAAKLIYEGVDFVCGQGTGMDGGAYFLGTDEALPPVPEDMAPVLLAAKHTNTPFIFSMGGHAGADVHLQTYLDAVAAIGRESGVTFRVAKVSGEIDPEYLKEKIRAGVEARRSIDSPRVSAVLSEADVDRSIRIQAQMGPEPIMRALAEPGIDGVITGRALDVGIFMAPLLSRGIDRSTAALVGKLAECSSMITEPANAWEAVLVEVDDDGTFTVRPASPTQRCTVNSVSAHSLYERENPFEERNPGGVLDVSSAKYEQLDDRTVRVAGGSWREVPYTVKIEGAEMIGYQASVIAALRDPRSVKHVDQLIDGARAAIETASGGDERISVVFHVFGRDGVLGQSEPLRGSATPHEVAIVMIVTAPTEQEALRLCITGRLRLLLGDFPGRRSTAGNTAMPYQRLDIPLGAAYVFNIWHLLPLEDPCEPFPYEVIELG